MKKQFRFKHFVKAAEIVEMMSDRVKAKIVAHHYAELFAHFNPRFDKSRFMRACGFAK